jgi:hypothetical protein
MPSTLECIVPELWFAIGASLEPKDLANLARSSSVLNHSIQPMLWNNVCIYIPPVTAPRAHHEMDSLDIDDDSDSESIDIMVGEHLDANGTQDQDGVVDNNSPGMRALELLASSSRVSQHVRHIRIVLRPPNYTGLWLPPAPPPFSVTRLIRKAILSLENLKSLNIFGGICSGGAQARELTNQLNERKGLCKLTFEECWFTPPMSGGSLALAHLTELDWSFLADCRSSSISCGKSI